MKRLVLPGVLAAVAVLGTGCGNTIDTAPNPTPTPVPTPVTGTYEVDPDTAQQTCTSSMDGPVTLTFNVPFVDIVIDGSSFTPDWGFTETAEFSVPDPEHGTIDDGDFTVNYTYCDYNFLANKTTKHVATWTGTFVAEGQFESTLHQTLRNATGNLVAGCGAGPTDGSVTTDMGACTSEGLTWQIDGEIEQ